MFFISLTAAISASAQYKVKGTVFDSSRLYRIESVTVMSTAGRMTLTDSMGRYQIDVAEKDSVWFSYLGKATPKYPVLKMADVSQFDIALKLKSDVMEEVRIKNRSYRMDSIQNRKDYAKVFDFHRPRFSEMTSVSDMGARFDLDAIIRLFQFKKNKATLKFQQRLLQQERDKFVDHRFSKGLVKQLTNLDGEALDHFMLLYRPSYEFTAAASDYDFGMYIKICYRKYSELKTF